MMDISKMDENETFADYPDDTVFVFKENFPVGVDMDTGLPVYENTEPKPQKIMKI